MENKSILFAAALALTAGAARASVLQVALGLSPTSGTAASASTLYWPGLGQVFNVYVFAKADTLQDPAGNSTTNPANGEGYVTHTGQTVAGGIRGLQFTVASTGTVSQVNFNAGGAATTFAIDSNDFALIKPSRIDVDADNDFDARAGSFSDAANFTNVTLGTPESATKMTAGPFAGYDLIATELWTVSSTTFSGATLSAMVVGPTYYDSNSPTNFQSNFASVLSAPAFVGDFPEPASPGIAGGIPLLIRGRRRR